MRAAASPSGSRKSREAVPNPNSGALYPVRPLLALARFPAAARLFPVLHWVLAGWGVIALLRTIGSTPGAAWLGAVTYVFSGVGVSEVFYPHIQPGMSLLPWIVWAVARPARSAVRRILLLAFLFALCLLAGDVFTIGLAVACGFLWIALETERSARLPLASNLRSVARSCSTSSMARVASSGAGHASRA